MKKILFISNITHKITSFSSSSIYAAHKMGMKFIHAANWSETPKEQIESLEKENDIIICNVPISRSPFSLSNIEAFKQLCRVVEENKVEYIHCNTPVGGLLGRLVGKKCNVKKVIYQAHGFHFYKGAPLINWIVYYPIERLLAHFSDAIITINTEDYKQAKKFHLRKKGQIYYVPGVGIDITEYTKIEKQRQEKRDELGLPNDDLVIISVGELNKNKNNSVIISALGIINNPHIHYILCGVGDEKEQMQTLTHELGLDDTIHFLGYRTDVKELYAASDIFVMPSFREGLSRSIMEAMASGLPCIVSKIRGNVDLIQNGKGGFLCEPHDANAFAEAISKLANAPALKERLSCHNLEEIKKYDISIVESKIKDIYIKSFN